MRKHYVASDRFSDSDLLAAQNTILYHLSNCSEYKISEKEMVQQIRVRHDHRNDKTHF